MEKEIWKDIKGYEGLYQVSNFGRVKSLGRYRVNKNGMKRYYGEKILKHLIKINDYHSVALYNNNVKHWRVSRLVYQTFCGGLVSGMSIDHKDHNVENNHIDNLQQITIRENSSKDKWRHNYTSKFVGVSFSCKRWKAQITFDGKIYPIGSFKTELGAHEAYQVVLKDYSRVYDYRKKYSSKFIGVSRCTMNENKWRACIGLNGVRYSIGRFDSELKAHEAYQSVLQDNSKLYDYRKQKNKV